MEDPESPQTLTAGWWKTKVGWKLALRTDGNDPRAKPLVLVAVLALFLLVAYLVKWRANAPLAQMAIIMFVMIVIAGPRDPSADPVPLQPGWWKTRAGHDAARNASMDDPALRPVVVVGGTLVFAALLLLSGMPFVPALVVGLVLGLGLSIAMGISIWAYVLALVLFAIVMVNAVSSQ
ncbi:MAG: hypothetical protein QNL12_14975 [Acidimicrobiia bacterium]|nr:hypothetical protein [Acidimicrobiia bacterium]MDX2468617.1 hypothetical protein [Acidimicrobiia bacterium]